MMPPHLKAMGGVLGGSNGWDNQRRLFVRKEAQGTGDGGGEEGEVPQVRQRADGRAPAPTARGDDSLDALYDLAQESEQHAAQQQLAPRCPGCMREMASNAILCTNCGYDTRSGKAIAAPKVEGTRFDPAKAAAATLDYGNKGKKTVDKMAPQGSFLKGIAGSVGGASIGAFVWFMIAWGTGYELYFIVLLVGALAGIGMQWGQEGYSYIGGFVAAAVTFVVMVVARIAVVLALVVPGLRAEASKAERQREELRMPDLSSWDQRVVQQLYEAERKAQKPLVAAPATPAPSDEDDEDWEDAQDEPDPYEKQEAAIYQGVEKKLKAMPKAQYDAMVKKLDAQEKAWRLEDYLTDEILRLVIRANPARASSTEHGQAQRAAKEKIAGMTPAQREAEYQRLHAQREKDQAREIAQAKREWDERRASRTQEEREAESAAAGAVAAFGAFVILLLVFGGFKGLIWTLLALGLAYRTASGSVSD